LASFAEPLSLEASLLESLDDASLTKEDSFVLDAFAEPLSLVDEPLSLDASLLLSWSLEHASLFEPWSTDEPTPLADPLSLEASFEERSSLDDSPVLFERMSDVESPAECSPLCDARSVSLVADDEP
jgi:hypothetical protein